MALVSIKDVSVSYDGCEALRDVSFNIYGNDFLGIIGPNGGGKTTLIKAILGSIPFSGKITYSNELKENGKYRIGYLPQTNSFDKKFPISVKEVVLSGLQSNKGFFKRYQSADRKKARQLIDMVGISDIANKPIGEISGGQMQRALLCRAVITEPKLLILDEPANFVDNMFESELYEILKHLNEQMAIIMVSHDIGTITSVVKNIVCVNRYVHRHNSNIITPEQLDNYGCPIQLVYHGDVPHTVLEHHH